MSGPDAKRAVRERVWALLEREGAARFPGARGRIPNFVGAEAAAERLASQPEWREARVVKANPDAPQLPVRARALAEGKLVYMAVPRLRKPRPFILLDPARLRVAPRRAASIGGAARAGRPVAIEEMRPVDLVVCGSVAVNRRGARVGKGGGFSDLEFALLVEAGLIGGGTTIATTVHPLQVLRGRLPETAHDFRVDRIVTPEEAVACRRGRRPPGVIWDHLDPEKVEAIPVLATLRGSDRTGPRGGGRVRWVVDAMNVIGSRPDRWWEDPDGAMRALVERLDRFAARTGEALTVVFDRRPSPPPRHPRGPVEVVFARPGRGDPADDEIVRIVGDDPDPSRLRVVTSDAALAGRVRERGAEVVGAGSFRRRIDRPGDRDDPGEGGEPDPP